MHMQNSAKTPREINDTIPEGLEEIVVRAMQKEAVKRYHSASEMIKDIEEFKKNPSIVFEYKYLSANDGSTRYFDRVQKTPPAQKKKRPKPVVEEYDNDDEEEEGTSKGKAFVLTLTAITAAVVIAVVFFVVALLFEKFGTPTAEFTMPNIIGMDYYEAKAQYPNITFNILSSNEYTSYPKNQIFYQDLEPNHSYKINAECNVKVSAGVKMVSVPDVYGFEYQVAQNQLKNEGFNPVIKKITDDLPLNYVVKTYPEKNELVAPGSTVTIFVSMGPDEKNFFMPNVVTMKSDEAKRLLESSEYGLIVTIEEVDSAEEAGTVIEQSIPEREITNPKTPVTLKVSSGEAPATTVDFIFVIPYGSSGAFTFRMYIDGQVVDETIKDNISYINDVTTSVTARGVKTVIAEVEYNKTGEKAKLAAYSVDFVNGVILERTYYDDEVFDDLTDSCSSNNNNGGSPIYSYNTTTAITTNGYKPEYITDSDGRIVE